MRKPPFVQTNNFNNSIITAEGDKHIAALSPPKKDDTYDLKYRQGRSVIRKVLIVYDKQRKCAKIYRL